MSEIKKWQERVVIGERGYDMGESIEAMTDEITELRARVAELDGQVFAMKRGNTILIDSLMGMVDQFFRDDGSGNLSHRFMAAEEYAIKTLLEAGFAEEIDGDYRLLWDKIEEREKSLNDEVRQ